MQSSTSLLVYFVVNSCKVPTVSIKVYVAYTGLLLCVGLTDEQITRLEMVTLLCTNDRTHSQLVDSLPEKCGLSGQVKEFDSTLQSVADYKPPVFEAGGSMQQGIYVPKSKSF